MKHLALKAFWGLALGIVISRIGFTNFDEVHKMFGLEDFRMVLAFALGTGLSMVYFTVISRGKIDNHKKFHPGILPGSVLFGAGWAVTGGCPAVALLQLSHGYVPAAVTLVAIVLGIASYRHVHARFFKWSSGSCEA